jgi:hypothetical protein
VRYAALCSALTATVWLFCGVAPGAVITLAALSGLAWLLAAAEDEDADEDEEGGY